jgi:Carboxypeptidase regulatory-like domain
MTAMNGKRRQMQCSLIRWSWLILGLLLCCKPVCPQVTPAGQFAENPSNDTQKIAPASAPQQVSPQQTGKISGKVVDQTSVIIVGATVKLTREGNSTGQEVITDEEGKFYFFNVPPGTFHLTFSSPGLTTRDVSDNLDPGQAYVSPLIVLSVATQATEVRVAMTPEEMATAEVKEQEKQRVLGIIPNFYVSYSPHPVPLTTKLKFQLAWKSSTDPFTFVAVGVVAGFSQAGDQWGAYGQGAEGYAKRYGATYGDVVIGTFIGGAILPSILKQDPRYFYRGTGSKKSRILYALGNSVICKGDNGKWQPNYSSILGNLAAGGIANLYYPPNDRNTAGAIFSAAFIRMGEIAVANIFQEFLVPKLTPNLPTRAPQAEDPPTF